MTKQNPPVGHDDDPVTIADEKDPGRDEAGDVWVCRLT